VRSPVLATIVGAARQAQTRPAKPLARWSRKASKLSFGVKSRDRESIREKESELTTPEKDLPNRPSVGDGVERDAQQRIVVVFQRVVDGAYGSCRGIAASGGEWDDDDRRVALLDESQTLRSHSPTKSKVLPPIPRDFGR
jgi:hypothetical protein